MNTPVFIGDWMIMSVADGEIKIVNTANDAKICVLPLTANSVTIKKIEK